MFTVRAFDPKTITWWHMEKDQIDFEPSYQRKGKLWSNRDKAFLIDSVLNKFDIPKIYVADFTFSSSNAAELNPSKKSYAIIDGKQRMEAIFDFIENRITLNDDFVYLEDPNIKLSGLSYKDLKINHSKIASKFDNFSLSVMSVITDQEGMINELFIRLNKSKPLTGSELRNAMKGIIPELIKKIASHDFFKIKVRFTTTRAQDHNVAAKLLLIEFRGKFVDTKKIDLDRFVAEAQETKTDNFRSAAERVLKTINLMNASFIDKDPLLKSSGILPVYYWLFKKNPLKYEQIRQFIYEFDKDRNNYIKQSKAYMQPDNIKPLDQLAHSVKLKESKFEVDNEGYFRIYQDFLRNPNDYSGLQGAYEVLEGFFIIYLINKGLAGDAAEKN